ncbi:aminotransferase class I/II-fold pyridoxal phosphate-dependent enzyme [Aequorivita marisscotiae]|uniref:Aminotransferase class I/II-fold pyridoxal phosphate-dependent enzyme n=1 Tax=Aequorivita marisscotiae TaxID=3040348 RepID=A0ABY8KRT8_9FLAO|nr:aminotransferase class I/II-fold pyridoxal phosphate-dependent enzyme [Aequorivita sp. Ant34-E75]WGF92175.1 aminotransferase class I/II-fold pyridoxal phosphate-dependent enzyme [Aequorivita sp. Ant34-E75]
MAKIKHNNFMDSIDEVISNAKQQGVIHLYADGKKLNGRKIGIANKELYHFGTTGYLGLEQDIRLKDAASKAIYDYGTQFPLSKTYISHPLYASLEEKLYEMYKQPIVVTKNSTLGHMAVIPTVVRDEDAVILDHQVHWSVQSAVQNLKIRNVPVEMIRHNNLNMLESKLKELNTKANKIWYMADGVYSMFGDFAPISELMNLTKKYPQLHLYIDDVHGMSWRGKHGTGFVASNFQSLPENILLFTTLSKTFGASGAVLVCPNKKFHQYIKNFGGPLTFSAQLEPASVAAAIASADIHLSDEIYSLQNQLQERIIYFNELLENTSLPLVDKNSSPVFYIGTGMPATGYNFVKRLLKEGFFVNLGLFPAVPVKNTGVRITIARHNQKEDMKKLVAAMEYHFPLALQDTQTSLQRVSKLFKLQSNGQGKSTLNESDIYLTYQSNIGAIDKKFWNTYMGNNNICDWEGLQFLFEAFSQNNDKEHNWNFHFYIVFDQNNVPVVITFFTTAIWKDDMLSPLSVSQKMEEKRKVDKYYASQKVTAMGSLFSEGTHQYTNIDHPEWHQAWRKILHHLEITAKKEGSQITVLRDFKNSTSPLNNFFIEQGFIKIQMPDACVIPQITWKDKTKYIQSLSKRSAKHYRKDILPYEELVVVQTMQSLPQATLIKCYQLYKNVKNKNFAINTYTYPFEVFHNMNKSAQWEFILLYPKTGVGVETPLGVMFCYKNSNNIYVPSLVGLDYSQLKKYQTYRQLLYQTILIATAQNFKSIDFGISASFEKKKLGATIIPMHAYIQAEDNFVLERLEIMR